MRRRDFIALFSTANPPSRASSTRFGKWRARIDWIEQGVVHHWGSAGRFPVRLLLWSARRFVDLGTYRPRARSDDYPCSLSCDRVRGVADPGSTNPVYGHDCGRNRLGRPLPHLPVDNSVICDAAASRRASGRHGAHLWPQKAAARAVVGLHESAPGRFCCKSLLGLLRTSERRTRFL